MAGADAAAGERGERDGSASWFVHLAQRREWLARANLLLLAVWIAAALLAFRHLPERIPMHFVLDGSPTRWDDLTIWRWLFLPLLTVALAAFLPLMERAQLAINRPYGIVPSDPAKAAAWKRLGRTYMDLCAALLIAALGALHLGVWMVATGRSPALPPAILLLAFGAVASILLLIVPLHRARARLRERSSPGGMGAPDLE